MAQSRHEQLMEELTTRECYGTSHHANVKPLRKPLSQEEEVAMLRGLVVRMAVLLEEQGVLDYNPLLLVDSSDRF